MAPSFTEGTLTSGQNLSCAIKILVGCPREELMGVLSQLFSCKAHHTTEPSVPRTLSWFDLVSLGVGGTVGSGVFVVYVAPLTVRTEPCSRICQLCSCGLVAATYAGPSSGLSFALAGLACAL